MYSLNNVAASVARVHPDGTKNPVRKSYKKYIKTLGLSGAFDVGKKEDDAPDTLLALVSQPDEEWEAQHSRGQEISRGFSDAVKGSMGTAFKMARGRIHKSQFDPSVLGEIATRPAEPAKSMLNGVKPHAAQGSAPARASKKVGEGPRPQRNLKKRSYGEDTYEGYGEGYADDIANRDDTGYSTGEGDNGRKRPKKVCYVCYQVRGHG